MLHRDLLWYLFSIFLILIGGAVVFEANSVSPVNAADLREGYILIALGSIIAVILALTGGVRYGNDRNG